MDKIIPEIIETENLVIRKALPEDAVRLQALCDGWGDKLLLEGELFDKDYIETCLLEGDLPPVEGASREAYLLMAICRKSDGEIVGFFDVYHGYTRADMLWISILLIRGDMQMMGYGNEVMNALSAEGKSLGYSSIGIAVHLKNWKGLRFWRRNGFDKILGIYGDKVYGENNFAIIGLEKSL